MSWEVINVHDYSTVSDYNYLVNEFDGVLISTCYRDGYTGTLNRNPKFDTQLAGFIPHKERIRIGYYIKSTAVNVEEIQAELAKHEEIIEAAKEDHPDDFIDDFPLFIELCWTDPGYLERIANMVVDRESILQAIKTYKEENDVTIGLLVNYVEFTNNVDPYNVDFYNYLVLSQNTLRPSHTMDGWQYVTSMSITTADKGIGKTEFYTDVADFANLPSNNIGYYIQGLVEVSFDYNYGDPIRPEVINPYGLTYGTDYIMYCTNNINVGNATAFIQGINAYAGTAVYNFNINRVDVGIIESLHPTTYDYDGLPHEPTPVVKNTKGKTLQKNVDYTVRYENNVNAGMALCIIEGKGNYIGRQTKEFYIDGMSLYVVVRLPQNTFEYTGTFIKPKPIVKHYEMGELKEGIHYRLLYERNIQVGNDAVCLVEGIGNFAGYKSVNFSIYPADISKNNWLKGLQDWEFTYNGKEHIVKVDSGGKLVEGEDYTIEDTSEDKINAGVKTVVVTGINNFTNTVNYEYTIVPQELPPEDRWTPFPDEFVYKGSPCEPDIVYTPGYHYELNPDVPDEDDDPSEDVYVDFGDQDDPENPPPTGEDDNSANFQDIDDPGYIPPDPEDEDPEWDFGEMSEIWILVPDPDLVKDVDYRLLYNNNNSVGTAEIIVEGIGNYTGRRIRNFVINPATIIPKYFTLLQTSFIYSGEPCEPEVRAMTGLILDVDYKVTYIDNIRVGTGQVYIEGIGNFRGDCIKEFQIEPIDISTVAEITCGEPIRYDYVYDNDNFAVTKLDGSGNLVMYDDYYYTFETIVYPVNPSYTQTTWHVHGLYNYTGEIVKTFITTVDGMIPDVPERYRPKPITPDDDEPTPVVPDDEADQKSEAQKEAEARDAYFKKYDSYYDDKGNHVWHPDKYVVDPEPKIPEDPTLTDEEPPRDVDRDFGDIDDPYYVPPGPEDDPYWWNFGDLDSSEPYPNNVDWDFGDQELVPDFDIIESVYYGSGTQIALLETKYYSSPVNWYAEPNTLSGVFYIYNYKIYNGRIRVTNTKDNVNRVGKCVGWVKLEDIMFVGLNVQVGDQVRVIDYIYKTAEGPASGRINKRDEVMTVVVLVETTDFNFGDIDTDKDYEITTESYDFGDIDDPEGYTDPDNFVEPTEEDETQEEDTGTTVEESQIDDNPEHYEYLDESDEEEYPLDVENEDPTDEGYDFNELSMVPNTDDGRYPVGLANTPNGSAVGYANTQMFVKLKIIIKDNRVA